MSGSCDILISRSRMTGWPEIKMSAVMCCITAVIIISCEKECSEYWKSFVRILVCHTHVICLYLCPGHSYSNRVLQLLVLQIRELNSFKLT